MGRTPLAELEARRIALIKPSALGDIVHTLPVLPALRRRYPSAHITWVVNREYQELLQGHPLLDAVLPFERAAFRRSPWEALRAVACIGRQLRQQRFDLVLDLQGLLRSGILSALTGAPRRVGLADAREGSSWFHTDHIPIPAAHGLHAVERYLLVPQALGASDRAPEMQLPLQPTALAWARHTLAEWPRPWLMLAAGARWRTKRGPPQHFAELAQRAQDTAGASIVLVGSADDRPLAAQVAARLLRPGLDLTGRTTLPQLAALLSMADLMLANDTGPLHLAAALGRPVIAPYTCTQVVRHGPYGQGFACVEAPVVCQGSYRKKCGHLTCMQALTPMHLWPLVAEGLQAWRSSSSSPAARQRVARS